MGLMDFIRGDEPKKGETPVTTPAPAPVAPAASETFWTPPATPTMTDVKASETGTIDTPLSTVLNDMSAPVSEVPKLPEMPMSGNEEVVIAEDRPVLEIIDGGNPNSTPTDITFSVENGGQVTPDVVVNDSSDIVMEMPEEAPALVETKPEANGDVSIESLNAMHERSEGMKRDQESALEKLRSDLADIQRMIADREAKLTHISNVVQPKIDAAKKKLQEVEDQRKTVVAEAKAAMAELEGDAKMIESSGEMAV